LISINKGVSCLFVYFFVAIKEKPKEHKKPLSGFYRGFLRIYLLFSAITAKNERGCPKTIV
jgi:hypothetical protein